MSIRGLVLVLLAILVFIACRHDSIMITPPPVDQTPAFTDTVCFESEILPLLITSCSGDGYQTCHASPQGEHGITLDSYSRIMGSNVIHAGDSKNSRLYKVLNWSGDDAMPPGNHLDSVDIALIGKWIDQGALETSCPDAICDSSIYTFSGAVWPTIRKNCRSCHNATISNAGIDLSSYNAIMDVVDSGILMKALRGQDSFKPMPPSGSLDSCRIDVISKWIHNGAHND